jgi:hypothetical protein
MEPLAVDLLLLRSLKAPDLRIAPGRSLMARVARADGSGRGALSIAGIIVEAELPKHVRAGEQVRLTVREVHAGKVVMSMADQQPIPQPAVPIPLPGGGALRVTQHSADDQGPDRPDATHVLSLRYDAPALGAVDLHFRLDPGSLQVEIELAHGKPVQHAEANAATLRDALTSSIDRSIALTVSARHDPLDLYA